MRRSVFTLAGMERPTGITLLAIVGFVSGSLHFLGSFLAFVSGSWLSAAAVSPGYFSPQSAPYVDAFGNLGFWIGLVGMAAAVVTLAAAAGLWTLMRWGYWLAIVSLCVNLVLDVAQALGGNLNISSLLGGCLAVVALGYLARPHTRHAFAGFPLDAPTRLS